VVLQTKTSLSQSNLHFTIQGELPSMNEIVKAAKSHYGNYSKMKKKWTGYVALCCGKLPAIPKDAFFSITYYCSSKRKDKDNISAAKKFIFDGLVTAKKMDNDGWAEIDGWEETFSIDKKNPRIEVSITVN